MKTGEKLIFLGLKLKQQTQTKITIHSGMKSNYHYYFDLKRALSALISSDWDQTAGRLCLTMVIAMRLPVQADIASDCGGSMRIYG